ncbi:hypothetical protein PCASD_14788 [Puccinia coronata f. sp. avenae]|uniref:Uncharacterized protein n=1 Tax=Puccinia coronata f. sp. avenae TaxID=200324 RepID=A0A2N5TBW4_9BASI|nr:hypothetical protein PCASD_14788 [Puccinia coronata f. sp. avenae]
MTNSTLKHFLSGVMMELQEFHVYHSISGGGMRLVDYKNQAFFSARTLTRNIIAELWNFSPDKPKRNNEHNELFLMSFASPCRVWATALIALAVRCKLTPPITESNCLEEPISASHFGSSWNFDPDDAHYDSPVLPDKFEDYFDFSSDFFPHSPIGSPTLAPPYHPAPLYHPAPPYHLAPNYHPPEQNEHESIALSNNFNDHDIPAQSNYIFNRDHVIPTAASIYPVHLPQLQQHDSGEKAIASLEERLNVAKVEEERRRAHVDSSGALKSLTEKMMGQPQAHLDQKKLRSIGSSLPAGTLPEHLGLTNSKSTPNKIMGCQTAASIYPVHLPQLHPYPSGKETIASLEEKLVVAKVEEERRRSHSMSSGAIRSLIEKPMGPPQARLDQRRLRPIESSLPAGTLPEQVDVTNSQPTPNKIMDWQLNLRPAKKNKQSNPFEVRSKEEAEFSMQQENRIASLQERLNSERVKEKLRQANYKPWYALMPSIEKQLGSRSTQVHPDRISTHSLESLPTEIWPEALGLTNDESSPNKVMERPKRKTIDPQSTATESAQNKMMASPKRNKIDPQNNASKATQTKIAASPERKNLVPQNTASTSIQIRKKQQQKNLRPKSGHSLQLRDQEFPPTNSGMLPGSLLTSTDKGKEEFPIGAEIKDKIKPPLKQEDLYYHPGEKLTKLSENDYNLLSALNRKKKIEEELAALSIKNTASASRQIRQQGEEAEAMTSVSSFIAVESHSPMKRLTHDRFCRLAGLYSGNREEALEQDIVLHFSVMSTYIHAAVVFFATNSPTLEFLKKTSIEERMPKGLYRLQPPAARSVAATDVTSVYQTDVTSAAPTDTLCLCSNVSVGPADIKSVWATDCARRGITPRRAGTSLHQPDEELFLGEQVQAGTCLPMNNASASWYKLVPARRRQRRRPPVKPRVGAV